MAAIDHHSGDGDNDSSSDDQRLADFLEADLLKASEDEEDAKNTGTSAYLLTVENKSQEILPTGADDRSSQEMAEDVPKSSRSDRNHDGEGGCPSSSRSGLEEEAEQKAEPGKDRRAAKRQRVQTLAGTAGIGITRDVDVGPDYSGYMGRLPTEMYLDILKFLSAEHDRVDMHEFVQNTPHDFREYYVQMQAAKRTQAPRPDQLHDDLVVLDTSIADQITEWRRARSLPEAYGGDHFCSGQQCSYHQIADVYLCEKTGRAHVCDENCKEIVLDPDNQLLVCSVSGRCFDRWLTPEEEDDDVAPGRLQAAGAAPADEGDALIGPSLARAYVMGYFADDERELLAAQRTLGY
eukprot:jgi/Mesen1/1059/ME000123S00229